jgi:hypothetical protein
MIIGLTSAKMRHPFSILFFACLFAMTVTANDTAVILGAGGLVPARSTQIVLESEDLFISPQRITIHYGFRNVSDQDVEAIVAFPLPDLNGGDVYNVPINLPNQADPNFVGFAVSQNGKAIPFSLEERALRDGKDITPRLASVGLSPNVLLEPLNAAVMKLPATIRHQLEREELIIPGDFNPPLRRIGNQGWWADWTMRVQFYWVQRFPANAEVKLEQSFRPVVGGGYIVAEDPGESSIKPYCGTGRDLQAIGELKKHHPVPQNGGAALSEQQIDYILTTANNWKGPIQKFRATVQTGSDQDILLTCTSGFKRTSSTQYTLIRSDFRPEQELRLLILHSAAQ